MKCKKHMM
jgi:hypothetical protein